MLTIASLDQYYGESHTLWDLDLEVPAGQCTCVMGRNGVGKTTLMKAIMGEVAVASGRIRFADDVELTRRRVEDRSRLGIGYVPQGRQIFPLLTVEENLRTGLAARGDGARRIPGRVYELFPVLEEMKHRRGGSLRRPAAAAGHRPGAGAGATAVDPRRAGEGIQPNIVTQIGEVIRRLIREDGLTVLLVEQKLPFAHKYADRFAIMDRGRPVAHGEIGDLSEALIREHLTV